MSRLSDSLAVVFLSNPAYLDLYDGKKLSVKKDILLPTSGKQKPLKWSVRFVYFTVLDEYTPKLNLYWLNVYIVNNCCYLTAISVFIGGGCVWINEKKHMGMFYYLSGFEIDWIELFWGSGENKTLNSVWFELWWPMHQHCFACLILEYLMKSEKLWPSDTLFLHCCNWLTKLSFRISTCSLEIMWHTLLWTAVLKVIKIKMLCWQIISWK